MNSIQSINKKELNFGSVTQTTPIDKLPEELLVYIFSFLTTKDLDTCSQVNLLWNRVTNEPRLWSCPRILVHDFSPAVEANVLRWKNANLLSPLSKFISHVYELHYLNCTRVTKKFHMDLMFSSPILKYGNLTFMIVAFADVKVFIEGQKESIHLNGIKGKLLQFLAVEGDYVFGLSSDGIIMQWNYKQQKFVNEIKTSYAKITDKSKVLERQFHVKNGLLAISYNLGFQKSLLEVIPYDNCSNSSILEVKPKFTFNHVDTDQILLESDRIFLSNRQSVEMYQRVDEKIISSREILFKTDTICRYIAIDKNFLFAIDRNFNNLTIINLKNDQQIQLNFPQYQSDDIKKFHGTRKAQVIGNLLFGTIDHRKIFIFDMNKKEEVKTLELKKNPNFKTLLIKLIKITKKHLNPLDIPELNLPEQNLPELNDTKRRCNIS